MVPMTKDETVTFEMGQRHGLADGFSVPRHLPGSMTGCCTFAVGSDTPMPYENIVVADALGATAIARARFLSGWPIPLPETKPTHPARTSVLAGKREPRTGQPRGA